MTDKHMSIFFAVLALIGGCALQLTYEMLKLEHEELVALKAHYAKMECVEVFDYPFENKQSGKK